MSAQGDKFKAMVEQSQDWFWEFDEHANFTYVSPRIRDLLGYEPEEILGKNAFDLMNPDEARRVHAHFDPIARKYQPFTRLINTNLHKDGYAVVIESSGTPIFDDHGVFRGYRGIDRDITERVRMEASLQDSSDKLQTIVETSPDWIWEIDLNGRHTYSNQRLSEILGYRPEEMLNTPYLDYLHEEDRQEVLEALPGKVADRCGWHNWVLRWRHADGSYRYLESDAVPILDAAGEVLGFRGTDRDITDRKNHELALQAATEEAEAANSAKSLFLAKLSHEIRTPLTAIIGYGELLAETELSTMQARFLDAIIASGDALSALIDDVLDLSKIEEGRLILKKGELHLPELLTKIVQMQKAQADRKGLTLELTVDDAIPAIVVGDQKRIQQVLCNLLGNAIKFTPQGGITVKATVAERSASRVLLDLAVSDTGVGIDAADRQRIFEPFTQLTTAEAGPTRGTGLGLSISLSLATLMGGTLRVDSQPGEGSSFHFLVPLDWYEASSRDDNEAGRPAHGSGRWQGPALDLLLAEDNPVNAEYVATILTRMGHRVRIAGNGRAALDQLQGRRFDLLLLDIDMPQLNGSDTLRTIREREQAGRRNRAIALTAYALIGDKEKFLQMGFDGYLSKPFTAGELAAEMRRVLSLTDHAAATSASDAG